LDSVRNRVWASALIPSLDHHSVAGGNRWSCCITHLVSVAFVSSGGPLPRRNLSHRPLLVRSKIAELCQPLSNLHRGHRSSVSRLMSY
jgi:hypothetical protein